LLLAGIIPLILTLIFGKVFCGWGCPFNLIAEYTDKLRRKIRPGSVKIQNSNPKVHYFWLVFGTIVMLMAVSGIPVITLISMPGLISAHVADLVFFSTIGIELSVVLIILLIEVFYKERFWCKFACPVGATLAFLRAKHTLSIYYDAKICSDQCPVDKFKLSLSDTDSIIFDQFGIPETWQNLIANVGYGVNGESGESPGGDGSIKAGCQTYPGVGHDDVGQQEKTPDENIGREFGNDQLKGPRETFHLKLPRDVRKPGCDENGNTARQEQDDRSHQDNG